MYCLASVLVTVASSRPIFDNSFALQYVSVVGNWLALLLGTAVLYTDTITPIHLFACAWESYVS
jgi:hypothetical protein